MAVRGGAPPTRCRRSPRRGARSRVPARRRSLTGTPRAWSAAAAGRASTPLAAAASTAAASPRDGASARTPRRGRRLTSKRGSLAPAPPATARCRPAGPTPPSEARTSGASTRGEHPSGATTSPWRRCGAGPNGVTGIPVAGACPRSDCGSLRSVRAWEKGWVEGGGSLGLCACEKTASRSASKQPAPRRRRECRLGAAPGQSWRANG